MKKIEEYKYIIIITTIILGFIFYWFQIRPINIKENCSWTTEIIKADPGVTKEQAEINKKMYKQCKIDNSTEGKLFDSPKCWLLKNDSVERLSQPERKEINETTKDEYNTCLRQQGKL